MISLVVVAVLTCAPPPKLKPRPQNISQQRLKYSFDILAKQPVPASFVFDVRPGR